jgi:L-erythro-3,5-diaminohexanoate dehydrogenase
VKQGHKFGVHRVLDPPGVLPQPAWRLDNSTEIYDNEILLEVDTLNIDVASFRQLERAAGGDAREIARRSLAIVQERGKHHNPETGSGGILLGTVQRIGPRLAGRDLLVGDRVATLISLSLTPLRLAEVVSVDRRTCQVRVKGQAVIFESGLYAKMPADLDERIALAVLDVAGAPAQTARLAKPGQTVLVIGAGGKSGLLATYQARRRVGAGGRVIALEQSEAGLGRLVRAGFADAVVHGSATDQLFVYEEVARLTQGEMADLTVNCVDVPHTELSSILATRQDGVVYFFSMATSFTAAALGAEGIGAATTMMIGNGYTEGHGELALDCLRESAVLREIFAQTYARGAGEPEPVGLKWPPALGGAG